MNGLSIPEVSRYLKVNFFPQNTSLAKVLWRSSTPYHLSEGLSMNEQALFLTSYFELRKNIVCMYGIDIN